MDQAMGSKRVICRSQRLRAENLSLYTSGMRDTKFLARLAQVLKAGKKAAASEGSST